MVTMRNRVQTLPEIYTKGFYLGEKLAFGKLIKQPRTL